MDGDVMPAEAPAPSLAAGFTEDRGEVHGRVRAVHHPSHGAAWYAPAAERVLPCFEVHDHRGTAVGRQAQPGSEEPVGELHLANAQVRHRHAFVVGGGVVPDFPAGVGEGRVGRGPHLRGQCCEPVARRLGHSIDDFLCYHAHHDPLCVRSLRRPSLRGKRGTTARVRCDLRHRWCVRRAPSGTASESAFTDRGATAETAMP